MLHRKPENGLLSRGIGFAGILAVGFAIAWAIDVGLAMIFLHTYQTGEEPHTADLFQTFRKDRFLRVVGGMAWMSLWIFLWPDFDEAELDRAIAAYQARDRRFGGVKK